MTHIKGQNIPNNYKLISFDVTLLFTNVSLDFTNDVTLNRIYDKNELNTNIPKQQIRDLLLPCTENVHFSYNGMSIHKQTVWQWVRRWVQCLQ